MPYGHRTYQFFYTMLCTGTHFNCIHDTIKMRRQQSQNLVGRTRSPLSAACGPQAAICHPRPSLFPVFHVYVYIYISIYNAYIYIVFFSQYQSVYYSNSIPSTYQFPIPILYPVPISVLFLFFSQYLSVSYSYSIPSTYQCPIPILFPVPISFLFLFYTQYLSVSYSYSIPSTYQFPIPILYQVPISFLFLFYTKYLSVSYSYSIPSTYQCPIPIQYPVPIIKYHMDSPHFSKYAILSSLFNSFLYKQVFSMYHRWIHMIQPMATPMVTEVSMVATASVPDHFYKFVLYVPLSTATCPTRALRVVA